jgi:hypothetical protein
MGFLFICANALLKVMDATWKIPWMSLFYQLSGHESLEKFENLPNK